MATETDPRGEWDVIHPQGQKFVRTITYTGAAAGDTVSWKLKATIGASADLASGVSPTAIVISAGVGYTLTIAASTMTGVAASPLSAPYYHYFEALDSTGTPKLTLAGKFTYPSREQIPLST